jgi:DNA polymerase-3 subunit epsilon
VLVPHVAWVERGFLAAALKRAGLRVAEPVLDTSGDALTTAQLFLALATRLDRVEPQTVGSLARLSKG